VIERLRPLHKKLGPPGPADWLAQHAEPGQTFAQYLAAKPVTARGARRVIYIQPIGDFTPTQRRIVKLTADYLERCYNLEVRTNSTIALADIPASARRVHPTWGDKQLLSSYILDDVLAPRLPEDAAAMIALTAADLWPGEGWNFVFGEASLSKRVGVWSIYRNGDPDREAAAFKLCLLRTLKTAAHEIGHMFSMEHCTAYECGMCGSNHRAESDRRPLYFCPECQAKICWATQTDPLAGYRRLLEFARREGLDPEAAFFEKSIRRLEE
jgi:archaemetzincin